MLLTGKKKSHHSIPSPRKKSCHFLHNSLFLVVGNGKTSATAKQLKGGREGGRYYYCDDDDVVGAGWRKERERERPWGKRQTQRIVFAPPLSFPFLPRAKVSFSRKQRLAIYYRVCPTNNATLTNFRLSSDAEILLVSTD